jgi:hypothetical protein
LAQDTPAPAEPKPTQPKAAEVQPVDDAAAPAREDAAAGGKRNDGPLAGQTRRIKQTLHLTEEQSAQFNRMLEKARDARTRMQGDVGRVLAEARAARAQNKSERFEEAVKRLREIAAPNDGLVLSELETILTDEQKPRLEEVRKRLDAAPDPGVQVIMEALVRLRGDARISKEQAPQFDRIVIGLCESLDPSPRTRDVDSDEVAEILAALQEAVAAGDEDKIRNIGARLVHEKAEPMDALISGVLDIDGILKEPQRQSLEAFVVAIPTLPKSPSQPREPRAMVQLARGCKLSPEQEAQLKELESHPVDRANPATASRDLYKAFAPILDVLTDEQWEQFRLGLKADRKRGVKKNGG